MIILLLSLAFNLMWWRIRIAKPRQLAVSDDHPEVVDIHAAYRFGALPYVVCVAVAFVNAIASVTLILALAIYWALKARPIRERTNR